MAAAPTGRTSQNGWPASPRGADIGIVTVAVPLRSGTKTMQVASRAAPALTEIVQWWDANVEPVTTLGSYNYREIRGYEGSNTISNHGSGTAIDINASKHPLGATNTVSALTAARITAKAASLGLRWGGNYRSRKDAMHFEVIFAPTAAAMVQRATGVASTAAKVWWWSSVVGLSVISVWWLYQRQRRP